MSGVPSAGDALDRLERWVPDIKAVKDLATVREALERQREERDVAKQMLALTCAEDVRLNGCACTPSAACYLHGVLIPRALADGLPEVPVEEMRFMHAAGVEYARAESAEAEVRQLRAETRTEREHRLLNETRRLEIERDAAEASVRRLTEGLRDLRTECKRSETGLIFTEPVIDRIDALLSAGPSDGGGA